MQIDPKEVDTVEAGGELDGSPVKIVRLKGGFFIATGKPKGKHKEEALAAGSHPAIVRYDLKKRHPSFQPVMAKSEDFKAEEIVDKHSHFLSDELRKSGYDIYSIQDGPEVNFHITKHNMKVASVSGLIQDNFLVIQDLNIPPQFSRGMAGATVEKATASNLGMRLKK